MSPEGPLVRVSLADQIRDHLTLEIAQGRLAPGTPVPAATTGTEPASRPAPSQASPPA